MLLRDICRILSWFFLGFAGLLLIPFAVALYYQFFNTAHHPQPNSSLAFVYSILTTVGIAFVCWVIGLKAHGRFYRREGLILVVLVWVITPALASLPYLFSQTLTDPLQAYFEAVSGLTTTGASVMQAKAYDPISGHEIPYIRTFCGVQDTTYLFWGNINPVRDPNTGSIVLEGIEAVSKAILFWRSMTQWVGGLGVIVLFVAILPALGMGGKLLYQTEVPGPIKDSLTPRITETALALWKIYMGLTVVQVLLLVIMNDKMGWFDAINITFATLSTGGFGTMNSSIAAYNSLSTEIIVLIFMVLGSINFALYYYALEGKFFRLYEPEFLLFLAMVLCFSGLTSYFIWGEHASTPNNPNKEALSAFEALRYGSFQCVSAMSSTGFSTASYDTWPYKAQVFLLIVMFVGGMAGSTAGGIKTVRHYLLFRIAQYKVESIFSPSSVRIFRIGSHEVDSNAAMMVLTFFLCVITVAVFGTLFFILDGIDPQTSLGLVACMVNNVGLAFRMGAESMAFLSPFSLTLSCAMMILGRLEFFAVLALLVPAFWRTTS